VGERAWFVARLGPAQQESVLPLSIPERYEGAMTQVRSLKSLVVWVLLQGCAVTGNVAPHDRNQDSTRGLLLVGKRFKPGKPKPPPQPPKPPSTNPGPTGTSESARTDGLGKPARPPARSAEPSYKLGESDGGPGQWEKAPARPKGAGYQREVTGAPEGVEYAVPAATKSGKVMFDGYKGGKLQDAKDWSRWPPENENFWQESLLEEAQRQINAARGTPIEWHLPSGDKANAVRALLRRNGIEGIDVKVTQKK
jgi:hypothetical protein